MKDNMIIQVIRMLLAPFSFIGSKMHSAVDSLFKYNDNLYYSYQEGVFYFYWCISWLVIRLTLRGYLVTLFFNESFSYSIQVILITLFSMGVAFMIAVVIGLFGSVTYFVQTTHMKLLFNNNYWITFVVSISAFHRYIAHTRVRIVLFIVFAMYLFTLNFFSTGLFSYYCLTLWLSFLYTFVYFNRVVFPIFPVVETTPEMLMEVDGDLYEESLHRYYGLPIQKIKGFYSQSSSSNKNHKEYHSSAKRLVHGEVVDFHGTKGSLVVYKPGYQTYNSTFYRYIRASMLNDVDPRPLIQAFEGINERPPQLSPFQQTILSWNKDQNPLKSLSRRILDTVVKLPQFQRITLATGVIFIGIPSIYICQYSHEEIIAFGSSIRESEMNPIAKFQTLYTTLTADSDAISSVRVNPGPEIKVIKEVVGELQLDTNPKFLGPAESFLEGREELLGSTQAKDLLNTQQEISLGQTDDAFLKDASRR